MTTNERIIRLDIKWLVMIEYHSHFQTPKRLTVNFKDKVEKRWKFLKA